MDDRYKERIDTVVDPDALLPGMPTDKVWMLLGETEELIRDFDRELAIAFLSCNLSEIKHLCTTVLRGKHDGYIKETLTKARDRMRSELDERKRSKS